MVSNFLNRKIVKSGGVNYNFLFDADGFLYISYVYSYKNYYKRLTIRTAFEGDVLFIVSEPESLGMWFDVIGYKVETNRKGKWLLLEKQPSKRYVMERVVPFLNFARSYLLANMNIINEWKKQTEE